MNEEHKNKIGLANKIVLKEYFMTPRGIAQRKRHSELMRGRRASPETRVKLRAHMISENAKRIKNGKHNWWKGGITPLRVKIYHSFKTRQWRSDIFERDDFTCQDCGKRGGYLEAHHLKEFSVILRDNDIKSLDKALACEELWNINNGVTLCKNCHNKTKKGRGTLDTATID